MDDCEPGGRGRSGASRRSTESLSPGKRLVGWAGQCLCLCVSVSLTVSLCLLPAPSAEPKS